ncbi:MAG: atpG [Candidatus Saccharibacteria bacterium]|nr:atpG [Candidatus Saccharibacteria bacterium]
MKRPQDIQLEINQTSTIVNLTSVFESLASMKISAIKNEVIASQLFFKEIWHIYEQIRVDSLFRFGRTKNDEAIKKTLYIGVTGEGGFSGDIDQRLVRMMLKDYDKEKHDIIIIGHHGAIQLAQSGVSFQRYFKMPAKDQNINVRPLITEISKYESAIVFYQSYESLSVQGTAQIDLSKAVQAQGLKSGEDIAGDVITDETYIFEPSTFEVVAHLEDSMLAIALSQFIFESKLAQYASRFRAMSAAKQKANESFGELRTQYNRTKRSIADARLKETINGFRKAED